MLRVFCLLVCAIAQTRPPGVVSDEPAAVSPSADKRLPTELADVLAERLRNPSPDVPAKWLTLAERTAFRQTPRYEPTIAFCRQLAEASEWIDYQSFGTSPEGREMPLLIASRDQAFDPAAAKAAGKPIVFAQACIHAGECAGKDACLMLLRDIAITQTRSALLDHVTLLVIPIFNVDGHERFGPHSRINQNGPEAMGWRVTSRNLNLNRDYMKADAVEMRAWLALWNAWRPDLHFDHHSTDGGNWQYDVMFATGTHEATSPHVARWLREEIIAELVPALEADGHIPMTYFCLVDSKDPSKGIRSGGFGPRYATGYCTVRNRPSFLVETHMLKSYRTRVIGHYDFMLHVLELVNRRPDSLLKAVRHADEEAMQWGLRYDPGRRLPVAVGRTNESVPFTFKGFAYHTERSNVSGDTRIIYDETRPIDVDTVWYHGTEITKEVVPPLAYVIPRQWKEVIELAEAHGLQLRRLSEPLSAEFETYRFEEVEFPSGPYEGRFEPRYKTVPIKETRTYLPGSALIPLDQVDAKLAVQLFEPEAPDSLVSWAFFNAIFERKEYAEHYVLEALARRMLEEDPKLREEFEARIRSDDEFAENAQARLYFFYERSPYWDDRRNIYPVARIIEPLEVLTGGPEKELETVEVPPPGPGEELSIVEDHWEDGTLRLRKQVLQKADGEVVNHGRYTRWHKNGRKEYEAVFIRGRKQGVAISWHKNGRKWLVERYRDGKRHGISTTWDEEGRKRKEERFYDGQPHGTWTVWDSKGRIKWQGKFEHGKPKS
jgi:hypothetical protein